MKLTLGKFTLSSESLSVDFSLKIHKRDLLVLLLRVLHNSCLGVLSASCSGVLCTSCLGMLCTVIEISSQTRSDFNLSFLSQQFGRTEVIDNTLNPDFVRKFILDYFFEERENLRFDL